jgi:hypothetical protein
VIQMNVKSNLDEVRARFGTLAQGIEDKATVAALNRTATTVRAAAVREIRREYGGLKAGAIRDELKIRRANRALLNAVIDLKGSRLPLIDFDARWKPGWKGVTVRVKRGRKLIPHAFIATMANGHRGVFVRAQSAKSGNVEFRFGKGSRRRKTGRDLPVAELTGISLPRAFVNKNVQAVLKTLAAETFIKNFRAELNFRSR